MENTRKLKQFKLLEDGFSIVEVMVALGVLAVGGYFFMSILKQGSMGQKTVLAQDDARILTDSMAQALTDPTACAKTFLGINPATGAPISAIKDKDGASLFVVSTPPTIYGNRGVALLALYVGGTGVDGKTNIVKWQPGSAPGTGVAFVSVNWQQTGSPGNKGTGPENLFRYFLVNVTGMNGNLIATCSAQASIGIPGSGTGVANYLAIWQSATSLSQSSVYQDPPTGLVGIGTINPMAKLHVDQGNIYSTLDDGWSGPIAVTYSTNPFHHSIFLGLRGRGSENSFTYPKSGDYLASFIGRDATDGLVNPAIYGGAFIGMKATQDFDPSNKGTNIIFATTDNGKVLPTQKMEIDHNGNVGIGPGNTYSRLTVFGKAQTIAIDDNTGSPHNPYLSIATNGVRQGYFGWGTPGANLFVTSDSALSLGSVGVERVRIDGAGNVGIGTESPGHKLDVIGDINSTTGLFVGGTQVCTSAGCICSGAGCTAASDGRLKKEIQPLNNSLENILGLQGVTYAWKEPRRYRGGPQIGLIAQDVEKMFPQVVVTDKLTGLKSVAYDHLIAPVIEAIKSIYSQIRAGENRLSRLEKENARLKQEIDSVKARLLRLESVSKNQ